jgi:hypothetical protein
VIVAHVPVPEIVNDIVLTVHVVARGVGAEATVGVAHGIVIAVVIHTAVPGDMTIVVVDPHGDATLGAREE